MPWLYTERTAVLLLFYCLRSLWLSSAQWLFEDSLKTNVSLPAVLCWLGQRVKKSINVPDASSSLDFIFLFRWRGEAGVATTAAGICKHATMPTHWHTIHRAVQCQQVCRDQLPVSLGIQASHHAAQCSQTSATRSELPTCPTPCWDLTTMLRDFFVCLGMIKVFTKFRVPTTN